MPLLYLAPGSEAGVVLKELSEPLPLGSIVVLSPSHWTPVIDLPLLTSVITGSPWVPLTALGHDAIPDDLTSIAPLLIPGRSPRDFVVVPPPPAQKGGDRFAKLLRVVSILILSPSFNILSGVLAISSQAS